MEDTKINSSDNKHKIILKNHFILKEVLEPEKIEGIVLPDHITEISRDAFSKCAVLKKVVLPADIKCIGANAFNSCTELNSIDFPDGIVKIDDGAFENTGLESIVLPDTLEQVGDSAFYNCGSVESLTVSENLRYIGDRAFGYMLKLGSLYIRTEKGTVGLKINGYAITDTLKIILDMVRKNDFSQADSSNYMLKYFVSSYYMVTGDEKARDFVTDRLDSVITNFIYRRDIKLIRNLLSMNDITIKMITDLSEQVRELCIKNNSEDILELFDECINNKLYVDYAEQKELVDNITKISPVPWKRVCMRTVCSAEICSINYLIEEAETGVISSMSTGQKRYRLLTGRRPSGLISELMKLSRSLYKAYEKAGAKIWRAVTFIVENGGKYRMEYEYDDLMSTAEWEVFFAGGVIPETEELYPAEKLS